MEKKWAKTGKKWETIKSNPKIRNFGKTAKKWEKFKSNPKLK